MSKNKPPLPFYPHEQDNEPHQKGVSDSTLLTRPHPEGYTAEWVESLKHPAFEESIPRQTLLVFRIKNEWLALPGHCIKEVTKAAFIHSLPHTNSGVLLGITNVQGELLVAVSMQNLLNIPDTTEPQLKRYAYSKYIRNIVFGSKKDIFVFPVDEIYGLTYIKSDQIEPVPISILKSSKNYFSGIFTLPDDILSVGLLDEKLIISGLNENYL